MIIHVGESVPSVRSHKPATDCAKSLADLGSQDASPGRHVGLRRSCVRVIKGPRRFRTLLCCHVDSTRAASLQVLGGACPERASDGINVVTERHQRRQV
jgi:hypothetical protein